MIEIMNDCENIEIFLNKLSLSSLQRSLRDPTPFS
jgi:hypothetical protein